MPRSEEALYRHVADDLRRQIVRGELPPGAQLSSERLLIGHYQASRNTVRKALELLANEGLVVSHQGKGYFVRNDTTLPFYGCRRDAKLKGSSEIYDVWRADIQALGHEPESDLTVKSIQPPVPAAIADSLELDRDQSVTARIRTRSVNGQPYSIETTYYPRDLIVGSPLLSADDITGDLDEVLAALGHEPTDHDDEIDARMPSPEEERTLNLRPGTPVFEYTRIGKDASGRPVRVHVSVLPGRRVRLKYEHGRA